MSNIDKKEKNLMIFTPHRVNTNYKSAHEPLHIIRWHGNIKNGLWIILMYHKNYVCKSPISSLQLNH